MKVILTSAIALDAQQQASMEKALGERLKAKDLECKFVVDPRVLGGIKITVGSQEFDGTLRARLNQIEDQLMSHL